MHGLTYRSAHSGSLTPECFPQVFEDSLGAEHGSGELEDVTVRWMILPAGLATRRIVRLHLTGLDMSPGKLAQVLATSPLALLMGMVKPKLGSVEPNSHGQKKIIADRRQD